MALPVISRVANHNSSLNQATYTTTSFNAAVGDEIAVHAYLTDTLTSATISVSTGAITFTKLDENLPIGVSTTSSYLWKGVVTSTVTGGTITVDVTGDNATGSCIEVFKCVNGTFWQWGENAGTAANTPAVTGLGALNTNGSYCGTLINSTNPAGCTAPSGWTEAFDDGHSLPATGIHSVFRNQGETATSVTWGATSPSGWAVYVVEFTPNLADGAASGTGTVTGVSAADKSATGSQSGTGTQTGVSAADKVATGSQAGTGTQTGVSAADKEATGSATGFGDASGDPYWNNVSLLLVADNADGSTTFTDASPNGHTLTANGNAQVDLNQTVLNAGAALLDGNGDYISASDHDSFTFPGDFTIDVILRRATTDPGMLVTKYANSTTDAEWYLYYNGTSLSFVGFFGNGASDFVNPNGAVSLPIDTDHVVSIDRVGNTYRLYANGSVVATLVDSNALKNGTQQLRIGGRDHATPLYFNGRINNVRITKGVGRYNGTHVVPTRSYPRGPGGVSQADKSATGSQAGTGTQTGVSLADKVAVGSQAGTGTVDGVGESESGGEATGSMSGTGTVTGISLADKVATGSMSGVGTVNGIGEYEDANARPDMARVILPGAPGQLMRI